MKREQKFYAAAAAVAVVSGAMIVRYAVRKHYRQKAYAATVFFGIAGLAASVALAVQPEREALKRLAVPSLFDGEEELALCNANIAEVLGDR